MPDIFKNDQILWYRNGVWGQLGYAVPNFELGAQTQNQTIQYLVYAMGRNLTGVMHSPDADLRVPPSINTLTRIQKLIDRARAIIGGRAVAPGTPNMEAVHVQPGAMDHLIFPVPYFNVRNQWLKEYAGLILAAIAEAIQHTENRQPFEISTTFAGVVSQYLQRVYVRMATELLRLDPAKATVAGFVIQPADLAGYNPPAWFSQTEMVDVTPPIVQLPTDVDLQVLTDGIPARQLVGLSKWPTGEAYDPMAGSTVTAQGTSAGGSTIPGLSPSGQSAAGNGTQTATGNNPNAGPTAAGSNATTAVPPFAAPPGP